MINGLKKDILINKLKFEMIKMKVTLLLTLIVIGFGNKMFAQAPNDCYETLSLFVEPAKAKNYVGALPYYDKVINECLSLIHI